MSYLIPHRKSTPAVTCICSFLTGLDALSLSHCSSFWLKQLDASPLWQSRLPALPDALHAAAYKALYQRTRSLGFTGLAISTTPAPRASDSYASILKVSSNTGKSLQLSRLRDTSFSFDLWFALLPQDPDRAYTGGVLFGLQSVQAESRTWPQFHKQFVLVSATRDLYCSVIDHRPVLKSDLQVGRWYHLALSYDHVSQRQDVYLDGARVRWDTGALHREMKFLKHEQVGTGCITANDLHFPKPGYLGWYGFHGLIDEFRVWGNVLAEENVAELARGQNGGEKMVMIGTLKLPGRAPRGSRWNVCEVRCSRPVEGKHVGMINYSSRRRGAIVRPEQLPPDTIETMCSFLTGFDAFNLSHTNSWWMHFLANGSRWESCLPEVATRDVDAARNWKEQYMLSRSMVFRGLQGHVDRQVDSYAYLTYAGDEQRRRSQFRLNYLGSESFSFDVWFSLLPGGDGQQFGGIIYGLQSSSRESRQWPYYHQQFVLVSSTGDLYCSLLDSRPVVASNLESNRWYHLTLTYDNEQQQQDVYLNGEKVDSSTGALHHEWGYLSHEQVGTGCITAGALNFPRPKYLGWYGFHGVIDAFRVWSGALSQDDVSELVRGGILPAERLQASVKANGAPERLVRPLLTWVNVQLTMCTRPAEGRSMQQVKFRSSSKPDCVIS